MKRPSTTRRIAAHFIDLIILVVTFLVLEVAATLAQYRGAISFSRTFNGCEIVGAVIPYIFDYAVLSLAYFTLLEGSAGWTIGKLAFDIRVTQQDGSPCRLVSAIIRNALRAIDWLPFLYITGMLTMHISNKKQRIGDIVAKTIIVRAAHGRSG